MTVTDLAAAATRIDSRRARSRQKKMGPSAVGGCRRRAGFMVADTPPTDSGGTKMAAILGTWIHKGALDVLKREFDALIEVAVEDDMLKGSADAVYLPLVRGGQMRTGATVEDVKTVGRFVFDWIVEGGLRRTHLWQVMLYAWLLREGKITARTRRRLRAAGWDQAQVPVEQVVVRYVCRDTGREHVETRDYEPKVVAEALEWIAQVYETVAEQGPEWLPRDEDGPGLSVICDGCKWLTACWGPEREDGGSRQANLIHSDADVAEALREYDRARAIEKEAKQAKALAREKLDASAPGIYDELQLGWSGGGFKNSADMEAIRDDYKRAGLEVPTKRTRSRPSISVKKPPPEKPAQAKTRAELTVVPTEL